MLPISQSWFIFDLFGFIKDPVVSKKTYDGRIGGWWLAPKSTVFSKISFISVEVE